MSYRHTAYYIIYTRSYIVVSMIKRTFTLKIALMLLLLLTLLSSLSVYHRSLYVKDIYTCRHMTLDIEDILESCGFNVLIHVGYINGSCGHMWFSIVGIHFDSVTLKPNNTNIEMYNNYYNVFNDYSDYEMWIKEIIKV